jgi:hypothetical protein
MKKRSLALFLLVFGMTGIGITGGTRIAVIPRGRGYQSDVEVALMEPLSFAVDSENSIYFLDSRRKQISVFDIKGNHRKNIGKNIIGSSIAVTEDGTIAVLRDDEIQLIDAEGNIQKITLSPDIELTEGYGQYLRVYQGNVYATQLNQHLKMAVQYKSGQYQTVHADDSIFELNSLPSKISNQTYTVEWKDNHLALVESSGGLHSSLTTSDVFGGLQIIGIDSAENIYVEAERITKDNYVHLDIYKLGSKGNILGVQEIPNNYSTTLYKKTELLNDGTILQVLTVPNGVELWKWTF